jgi:uncharacterized protein YjbI with pentapeptide repeats
MNTKSLQSQPYNGEATMFKDFWEIDKSQGESRFSQLLGIWLLICLIPFSILHLEGANLSGANLKSANLPFSDISDAELEKANFKGVKLEGTEILDSNLNSTNSQDVVLQKNNS